MVRVSCVIVLPELMAFAINNENHAHRHEGGRDDQNQNPAAQGLNHASARGSRLRITQRTTLGKGREGRGEHGQRNQRKTAMQDWLCSTLFFSLDLSS